MGEGKVVIHMGRETRGALRLLATVLLCTIFLDCSTHGRRKGDSTDSEESVNVLPFDVEKIHCNLSFEIRDVGFFHERKYFRTWVENTDINVQNAKYVIKGEMSAEEAARYGNYYVGYYWNKLLYKVELFFTHEMMSRWLLDIGGSIIQRKTEQQLVGVGFLLNYKAKVNMLEEIEYFPHAKIINTYRDDAHVGRVEVYYGNGKVVKLVRYGALEDDKSVVVYDYKKEQLRYYDENDKLIGRYHIKMIYK